MDEKARILVVDDEKVIREILADFLELEGFAVSTAEDGRAALTAISRESFDLVLTDLKMPTMGGIELLHAMREHSIDIVTIIMTGFGTVETAIDAMKRGAYDYILKPFKVEEVVQAIRRGLEKKRLEAENLRLRETLSLYKVSEAIAMSLSLEQVLQTITETALDEVRADVISVWLSDGKGGYFERVRELAEGFSIDGDIGDIDIEHLQRYFAGNDVLLMHGEEGLRFFHTTPSGAALCSMIATTLVIRNRAMGFLIARSYSSQRRFDEGQRKLLKMVGNRAAAAIENARLYEDLQATFRQTIRGLASAIDKMDRYTAGHSERVAEYSQMLARKIGLDEGAIEIVRQSALMHDVGKIGCVMNLNKPGKLSEEEYAVFQRHPIYGKDILEPITFLHPLIPGVHLHHERWDGQGYPLGLKGQEIPLYARLISVADTYDAMTSDRAYRKALPHNVAVSEIKRCSGTQFDSDLAQVFFEAIALHREGIGP